MSAHYEIRSEAAAGYPWITFQGDVTLEDIFRAIDDLSVEGAYGTHSRLWDFRSCTVDLSNEELSRIVEYGSARDREPGRVAILADTDFVFGLGRMYEVFRSSELSRYRAFRKEAEALDWLGESPDRSTPE